MGEYLLSYVRLGGNLHFYFHVLGCFLKVWGKQVPSVAIGLGFSDGLFAGLCL